jgi:glycosyltransferase involved in cell wall biosynthesis
VNLEIWGHVPIPLGTLRSSILTVIRQLTLEHGLLGGASRVVLSDNRDARVDSSADLYVDYTRHCPREWFSVSERAQDHLAGALLFNRPFASKLFIPAVERIRESGVDVLFLHEGHNATASLPLWKSSLPDVPVILYVHTRPSRGYFRPELRRLLNHADGLVFVSQAARADLLGRYGAESFRVPSVVVHNGLDEGIFHSTGKQPRLEEGVLRVTYAGELAPYKGVHHLLAAVAACHSRIQLRIVGGSTGRPQESPMSAYEVSLRDFATKNGVACEFVPRVGQLELAELFRASDVVAVPSVLEAFGMVAREAAACGSVVIASRRGGLPESAGPHAVYIDPANVRQFACALDRLNDPNILSELQSEATAWVAERTWTTAYRMVHEFAGKLV